MSFQTRSYFISQCCGCAKKDTQETGCRERQDFLHMILPKSLKKAKRFLVDRQQAEERPRGRFGEQAVRMNMTSKIGETLLVARWGRTLTVWYGSYREHAWTADLFLHAGRADYPWETARGLTSCFFKERCQDPREVGLAGCSCLSRKFATKEGCYPGRLPGWADAFVPF